jgi:hypothetical protein
MPDGGRARAVAAGAYGRLTSRARALLSTESRPAHERPGHQRRRHATPQGLSPRTWINSAGAAGRAELSQVPPTDRVSCASKAPPGTSVAVVPTQHPGQHRRHFSESARAKQSWLLKCCPARTRLRRPAAVSVAAECESAGWLQHQLVTGRDAVAVPSWCAGAGKLQHLVAGRARPGIAVHFCVARTRAQSTCYRAPLLSRTHSAMKEPMAGGGDEMA